LVVQRFCERVTSIPLHRNLLGHLFVEHVGERALRVALTQQTVIWNCLSHRRKEPLNEQPLELKRALPESSFVTLDRRGMANGTD